MRLRLLIAPLLAAASLAWNPAQAGPLTGQAYQITETYAQYFGPPGGLQVFNGSGSHSYSGVLGAGYEATYMGMGTFDYRGAVNGASGWLDIDPTLNQITAWVYVDRYGRYMDPWNIHLVLPGWTDGVFTGASLIYDVATYATPTIAFAGNTLDISLAGQHAGGCTVDGCVWEFRFGYTTGAAPAPTGPDSPGSSVPEPGSLALAAAGLGLLAFKRRSIRLPHRAAKPASPNPTDTACDPSSGGCGP